MKKLSPAVIAFLILALCISVNAQEFNYIGVKKCSMCHKSEKQGAQLTKWQNGPHSRLTKHLRQKKPTKLQRKMVSIPPQLKLMLV